MAELGLQLVQKATWEQILAKHEEKAEGDINLDQWQDYFSKHLTNLFTLAEKIRNYQVQAEFFKKLLLIQQKGRQILISLKKNRRGNSYTVAPRKTRLLFGPMLYLSNSNKAKEGQFGKTRTGSS